MKEKAMTEDERICRNLVVAMLCAVVLSLVFLGWREVKRSWTPDKKLLWFLLRPQSRLQGEEKKKVLVYELAWPDEEDGRAVVRRERIFLDEETRQPRKIEKYLSDDWDGEYVLEETVLIKDPNGEGDVNDVND